MGISLKQRLILWIEDYLFFPSLFQRFISLLLLPLTFIYHLILIVKRVRAKAQDFGLPVISVGNLIIGGSSGKTPLVIYLAKDKKNVAIVLRGYGRGEEEEGKRTEGKEGKKRRRRSRFSLARAKHRRIPSPTMLAFLRSLLSFQP